MLVGGRWWKLCCKLMVKGLSGCEVEDVFGAVLSGRLENGCCVAERE